MSNLFRISPTTSILAVVILAVGCLPGVYESEEPAQEEIVESDWEPIRTAEGEPLDDEELAGLLGRLPQLDDREDDEVEFKRRPDSPPPPLTGEDVEGDWPPDFSRPSAQPTRDGPLRAQAFRPEGEVAPPFQVAVAFDRPVVDVGAVGTQTIPDELQLTPAIDGRWRWLGTQTIVFEPEDRWPMATEFDVALSAGLEAVDGSRLDDDLRFAFTTPAPQVQQIRPQLRRFRQHGGYDTDTPVAVVFNQAIDIQSAEAISVRENDEEVSMRLLEGDALREAADRLGVTDAADEDRVIAMAPTRDFELAARIDVHVEGPLASREGPVVGMADESVSFPIRGPFRLTNVTCGGRSTDCRPGSAIQFEFNNSIDDTEDIEVDVDPPVENLDVSVRGRRLHVRGDVRARTDYTLTLPQTLTDEFGQQLEGDRSGTISVGSHRPFVAGPDKQMIVRPPEVSPTLPVMVGELEQFRARIYRVAPDDWRTFASYSPRRDGDFEAELVDETTIEIPTESRHQSTEHLVDAAAAFDDGSGHAVVVVDRPEPWEERGRYEPRWAWWIQRTDIAADVTTDGRRIAVDARRISDGTPLQNARVSMGTHYIDTADERGDVVFDVPEENVSRRQPLVIDTGDDTLMVPPGATSSMPRARGEWNSRATSDRLLWYVVDDRKTYKPGETVHLRGWIRSVEDTPRSRPAGLADGHTVNYAVQGPRRNDVADGQVELDAFGGFDIEFDVPETTNLGAASIRLSTRLDGQRHRHHHRVQFQEFRRPEYEVELETDESPHLVGEETGWQATASYYAGGPVAGADSQWKFDESSASWRPAGWRGWSFGPWRPWWGPVFLRGGDRDEEGGVLPERFDEAFEAQTDEAGRDQTAFAFDTPRRGFPRRVSGTISVQDVDRQAWEATESVLVHPAAVYVGLRADDRYISRDETFDLQLVAVDIDGDEIENRDIEVTLQRRRSDGWNDTETCRVSSAAEPVECSFGELNPGSYRAVAAVEDRAGRVAESELGFWVTGRDRSGAETAEEDELILIPDADEYAPGDRAELMVQAPYYPIETVVELRRDGRYDRRRATLTADDPTISFDVDEAMIPNVHVSVAAVGDGDAYDPERFASGSMKLEVERTVRGLDVELTPESDEIEPGAETTFNARVTDSGGNPVDDAQILFFGVDESVLALSNYELADPLSTFYPKRSPRVDDIRSLEWLLLDTSLSAPEDGAEYMGDRGAAMGRGGGPQPEVAMAMESAPDDAAGGDGSEPMQLREVFDALAFFRTDLTTDADGRVEITERMPDSLTRYRLMAVAVGDDDITFGRNEAEVTARKPLMVSPSAPRFANVGDEFDLPVVVHNRTGEDKIVDIALRASRGLAFGETPGRRIEVPADERIETHFIVRAQTAGDKRIQVAVTDDEHDDAELVTFPVLTPATTEAFATYGTIDAGDDDAILEALSVPTNAHTAYGGLEVSTSSTQLQALTDAFIYLTNYPFRSAPQLASRILSVLALHDVLDAFEAADLPDESELEESLDAWVDELENLQRGDGGFGFWPRSTRSRPFVSVHATRALSMADRNGIDVSARTLRQAENYLADIDSHVESLPDRAAGTVEAYAIYVLQQFGETPAQRITGMIGRYGIEELSIEALGWLLPVAQNTPADEDRILQRITAQARETAATAEFQETYESGAHRILHTARRTDGVILDGLLQTNPDHPLAEKVTRGLLAHRQRGRWSNTQENVFILMALRRYFDEHEDVDPDFIARAWLGDDQIAEHHFDGRTTERHHVDVPMSFLTDTDRWPVVFERDGAGRMYYRLGIDYAPRSRHLPPEDQGFVVERSYRAVDDPDDVQRTDDGWQIRAGARVRVELSMTIPARRYHVALVDWLPAGFEPLNPALATTDVSDVDTTASHVRRGWWGFPWYRHQNLRDERVEAFAPQISEGTYTYSYVARATTPGRFIAMPAKAEEMYHPETFGRSSTEVVTVDEIP